MFNYLLDGNYKDQRTIPTNQWMSGRQYPQDYEKQSFSSSEGAAIILIVSVYTKTITMINKDVLPAYIYDDIKKILMPEKNCETKLSSSNCMNSEQNFCCIWLEEKLINERFGHPQCTVNNRQLTEYNSHTV